MPYELEQDFMEPLRKLNATLEPPLAQATGSAFSEAAVMLWAIQRRMTRGCGNHGCRIGKIEGMAPNGRCTCTAREFARELRDIAEMLSPNESSSPTAGGGSGGAQPKETK